MIKKYILIISITIITTVSSILLGAMGWVYQFVGVGIFYFLTSTFLIKKTSGKKRIIYLLILFLPFFLLYGYAVLSRYNLSRDFTILPILIIPFLSIVIALLINKKAFQLIYMVFFIVLGSIFMINWINYSYDNSNKIGNSFPKISMININNEPFVFPKNKISVIDLWSSSCGICIEKFPEFDLLKDKYKDYSNVEFYSLNLPLKRDNSQKVKSYVENYSFKSLFVVNGDSRKKLNVRSVPKFLVLDKSSKIVYKGSLNDKWYHVYNNINDLIIKYSNE